MDIQIIEKYIISYGLNVIIAIAIFIIGAVGLDVGLAFKNTLSNISARVMIIIFRPIQVGDFVEAGGTSGTVEMINYNLTLLKKLN